MGDLILGIDIGTTGTKCTIYNYSGEIAASAYQDYPMIHPQLNWTEQDPNVWWSCVRSNLHKCFENDGINSGRISVIGLSCTNAVTLVDSCGNPLYNAIGLHDQRSDEQVRWLENKIGSSRLRKTGGNRLAKGTCALTSMRWIIDNHPELICRGNKFLTPDGFIIKKLTDRFSINCSRMDLTLLGSIHTGKWEKDIIDLAEVPEYLLPPVYNSDEIVGTVTRQAAEATGLKEGTPVTAGAVDTMAATIGSGAVNTGDFAITIGSSGRICSISGSPAEDEKLLNIHLAFDNRYVICQSTDNAGVSLRWFRDSFGDAFKESAAINGVNLYRQIDLAAEKSGPGADGIIFLPYLSGEKSPIWNSHARGVFFNIGLNTSIGSFARAVLEGVAFSIKECSELVVNESNRDEPIPIGGGVANSPLWCQIFADILDRPMLRLKSNETETLGDMIIAAQAIGIKEIPKDFGKAMARKGEIIYPDRNNRGLYEQCYQKYKDLYQALKPVYY